MSHPIHPVAGELSYVWIFNLHSGPIRHQPTCVTFNGYYLDYQALNKPPLFFSIFFKHIIHLFFSQL